MAPPNRSRSGGNRPPQRRHNGPPGSRLPAPPPQIRTPENKEEAIEVDGTVSAVLAGTMFRVTLRNGHTVLAHISGKMRKKFIRLVIGDNVRLEMSQYDPDKARIVYRL
jgi:translation initiation factor IF-1